MWWLKCHCVEPRLLAGWHGARCARITNATQTQKNPNSASATAQPPSPHPRPPPRRSHSHATGDQTKHLASRPASHCCTPPARPRSQNPPNHRNHQPHHSTHQPRPAALGWAPSHPARLTRPPTDQKDRLSTRTHLFRPPRRAAGRACRAARLGRGSGSCTRNRAGGGPGVGSWLGFAL